MITAVQDTQTPKQGEGRCPSQGTRGPCCGLPGTDVNLNRGRRSSVGAGVTGVARSSVF